jgi:hypothetical protein
MAKWIGAAILAMALMSGRAAISPVLAAPSPAALQKSMQTHRAEHFSARRRHHHRYAYLMPRPYDPVYYDRPYYYAPKPFFPLFGLGYGPWW